MFKKICLVVLIIVLFCSVCSAKPNEWQNKYYDFTKVKTMVIISLQTSKDVVDPYAMQKTVDMLIPEFKKTNVNIILLTDVIKKMSIDLNIDLELLAKTDQKKYFGVVAANLPNYADIGLVIDIYQLGHTKQYVPPSNFNYTTYNTSYYYGSSGSGYIQSPVNNKISIPGGYSDFPTASVGITLFDLKSIEVVWGYADYRDDKRKGVFGEYTPEENMKKIIEKAFDKMPIPKKHNGKTGE